MGIILSPYIFEHGTFTRLYYNEALLQHFQNYLHLLTAAHFYMWMTKQSTGGKYRLNNRQCKLPKRNQSLSDGGTESLCLMRFNLV